MLFYVLCQRTKAFVYGKINSKLLMLRVRKMSLNAMTSQIYLGKQLKQPMNLHKLG